MARVSAALVLGLCVVAAGCGGDGDTDATQSETPATSDGSTADPGEFQSEVAALCGRLRQADEAVNDAETKAEFEDAADALAEEQQRFVDEAEGLTPPPEVNEPFSTYLDGLHQIIELNEESAEGGSPVEQLENKLEAANHAVDSFEAKEAADLSENCPPGSSDEVYGYLFQARANLACEELLGEFATLQASTGTRRESAKMMERMEDLAATHANEIAQALPPQIADDEIRQMIRLYEKQIPILERMRHAFVTKDEPAFEKAIAERNRLVARADRIAASYGLTQCVKFMDVGTS